MGPRTLKISWIVILKLSMLDVILNVNSVLNNINILYSSLGTDTPDTLDRPGTGVERTVPGIWMKFSSAGLLILIQKTLLRFQLDRQLFATLLFHILTVEFTKIICVLLLLLPLLLLLLLLTWLHFLDFFASSCCFSTTVARTS